MNAQVSVVMLYHCCLHEEVYKMATYNHMPVIRNFFTFITT